MNDFYNTRMGHEFYMATFPRLVRAAESIADSLSAFAKEQGTISPATAWIVTIINGGNGEIETYRAEGTEEAMRAHLFSLIKKAKDAAGNKWQYGTESAEDIDYDQFQMYGHACISVKKGIDSYMVDFVATKEIKKTI